MEEDDGLVGSSIEVAAATATASTSKQQSPRYNSTSSSLRSSAQTAVAVLRPVSMDQRILP